MAYVETNRPISAIFFDLVNQITALVRKEGQLARAEMSEKIGEIGVALCLLVGGAVLLIPALVILLQAAVTGLTAAGIAAGWAGLIVGGVTLLIGVALLAVGVSRLKAKTTRPYQDNRAATARCGRRHSANVERQWKPRARGLSEKPRRPANNYRQLLKSCDAG